MNKKSMWGYLKLDSFDVEISFYKSKKSIISFLHEKNIPFETPTEMQVIIKSKMFSLDIYFSIAFLFNSEKLIAITMSPDTALEGGALHSRYDKIQKTLENKLGPPRNGLRLIMNLLDPDGRSSRWQGKGIIIKHYLLNRFGMEEIIDIKL